MPAFLLSVGFRAEFLIGFQETDHDENDNFASLSKLLNNGESHADPPPPPVPDPQLIRLPVRSSLDSHDRVLLSAVVNALGKSLAISEFIEETDPIYPLLTVNSARAPLFAKSQFWFTHRWFVASATTASGHFVGPLVPVMLPPPPRPGGSPQAPSPLLTYSWRPVAVCTPVFMVPDLLPDMFTLPNHQQDFAARFSEAQQRSVTLVSAPLQSLRSSVLTQLNDSCSFVVHVGLGCPSEENDPRRLLALKKMVTILWLGGEAYLAQLAGPRAYTFTSLLTESAGLRVRPLGFEGLLFKILDDDQGSNAAYDEWLSPLLGPAPVLADVHKQAFQRSLVDYALRQETPGDTHRSRRARSRSSNSSNGISSTPPASAPSFPSFSLSYISSIEPARRAALYSQYGVNDDLTIPHELFLLWRAHDVDTIAKLMTPYFWKSPSSVPLQHCAIDFVNLRNDVREERRSTHHSTIAFRLFPPTLDPPMVLAWTRLSAGLAAQAAFSSPAQFLKICSRFYSGPKGDGNSTSGSNSDDGNNSSVGGGGGGFGSSDYGGSSGNDGDNESSDNSSDSDGADTVRGVEDVNVAPELFLQFHQASIVAPPTDNWVPPPGLTLPIAHPPAPIPAPVIQAPVDNWVAPPDLALPIAQPPARVLARPPRPRLRLITSFTDTERETANIAYSSSQIDAIMDSLDNHADGSEGWTSDSLPCTSVEDGNTPTPTGAQPMDLTSGESECSSSFQSEHESGSVSQSSEPHEDDVSMNESDNHADGTDGWTSDSLPYTSAEEEGAPTQPMDTTSDESESSSSSLSDSDADINESDNHADGTNGWTSDSLPYTSAEEEDAPTPTGAQPMDITSDELESSSSSLSDSDVDIGESDNHADGTDGWSSDSLPYTSALENDSLAQPMDNTSSDESSSAHASFESHSENESQSSASQDVEVTMTDIDNHADGTDGWTSDSLPYTSASESNSLAQPIDIMSPSECCSAQESSQSHSESESDSQKQSDSQGIDVTITDIDNNHADGTDGWTSDSLPYTSASDSEPHNNQSVSQNASSDRASHDGNDQNDSPPPPSNGAVIPGASFTEDTQSDSSSEGSPMNGHVRDNSNDLDVEPFDVWAFVRWLNVGSEPLETLRRFVQDHNNVNPEDQPLADGALPSFPR